MKRSTYFSGLEMAISSDRLISYRQAGDTDTDTYARYLWNMALSETLYPALKCFEVALRNGMHRAAIKHFSTPMWFDHKLPNGTWLLNQRAREVVDTVKQELRRRNKPITDGRIVAGLTLGFWTKLAGKDYDQTFWRYIAAETFPHAPPSMRYRQTMLKHLDNIRWLRNRVAHYEPIWGLPNLQQRHAEIVEVLGWLSPEMREMTTCCDRFPMVLSMGVNQHRIRLQGVIQHLPA